MTLVIAVTTEKSIWLLTDRRLSYLKRTPKDDARKLLILTTTDGCALLGYAGLGATAKGTEPGDWMQGVLRGRNLPLETSLKVIAAKVKEKLPQHIAQRLAAHHIIIPAFLNGESRLYSIDLVCPPGRKGYLFRLIRQVTGSPFPKCQTPRICVAGSGMQHLRNNQQWARDLLKTVSKYNTGRVTPLTVAKALARINHKVAQLDSTVGPRCIVVWRLQDGGGANEFFSGEQKEILTSPVWLPEIGCGLDINSILKVTLPMIGFMSPSGLKKEIDKDAINTELAKLPDKPDDNLP